MLVFIDESYHDAGTTNAKSTFSAFLIDEARYREFDRKLFDLKRHYWKALTPYDMELKGRKLLSERALLQPKNRDFVDQYTYLCREVGAVLFAVVQNGIFTLASDSTRLPNLYRALMKRVNVYMEDKYPTAQALFFFDGIDHQTNRKIAISFNNFMYRHRGGQTYKNIIPTPFFCDSEVSPGIQIADVVAYCVNQRYGGRRGYLEEIFQKFRALSYNHEDPDEETTLWGFSQVKADEPTLPFSGVALIEAESTVITTPTGTTEMLEIETSVHTVEVKKRRKNEEETGDS